MQQSPFADSYPLLAFTVPITAFRHIVYTGILLFTAEERFNKTILVAFAVEPPMPVKKRDTYDTASFGGFGHGRNRHCSDWADSTEVRPHLE